MGKARAAEVSSLLSLRVQSRGARAESALSPCKGTSNPRVLPRHSPPKPLLPRERRYRLAQGTSARHFCLPSDAWQQAAWVPGMTGHLSIWLAVVFSCGKASDYPESPSGLCLAGSSAQALSSVLLPGADAHSRLTCDELAKRAHSASWSNKPRLCPLNLSVAGMSVAVGATLVTWALNTGSPLQPAPADILMLC